MRTKISKAAPVCMAIGLVHVSVTSNAEQGIGSDEERVAAASLQAQNTSSGRAVALERSERNRSLEEVVVTAQRREEKLEDVPISISVLTGEQLDTSTDPKLKDTFYRIPGIAPITISLGNPNVVVRGVGPSPAGAGATIGYYVDSVPFGFARHVFSPDMNAYDFDRIEVLRGPQGTLYGANSMNGVVRLLTKAPDLTRLEAKTRASIASIEDGGESYRADAAVNIPLIQDRLAMRLVGGYQELGGWIDKPFEEDANDGEVKTLRAKLRAQPTDAFMLEGSAWFSRRSFGAQDLGLDNRTTTAPVDEPASHDFDTFSMTAAYDFGGISLRSATSYIDYETHSVLSLELFVPGATNYISPSLAFGKVISEELTLQSTREGPWWWSIGAMYRDAKDRNRIEDNGGDAQAYPGAVNLIYNDFSDRSRSSAIFGEATRQLAGGKVEATLGLRYFHDKFSTEENELPTFADRSLVDAEDTSDALTPRAVLAWHPTGSSTVYTSYAQGFRSGLPQTPATFGDPRFAASGAPRSAKPDKLSNYEVGAKGTVLEGKLSFETAIYYMDWQDVKVQLTLGPVLGGVSALVNGSGASGAGVETAITFRPIGGFQIGGNVSWNDLTSDEDVISGGEILLRKGDRLVWSPETTANGFAEFSFPLGGELTGLLSGSVNYLSSWREVNLPGPRVFESDSITTTSARFTIDSDKGWSASLFGDNLGDDNPRVTPTGGFLILMGRNPPRTIGVQLDYHFN